MRCLMVIIYGRHEYFDINAEPRPKPAPSTEQLRRLYEQHDEDDKQLDDELRHRPAAAAAAKLVAVAWQPKLRHEHAAGK